MATDPWVVREKNDTLDFHTIIVDHLTGKCIGQTHTMEEDRMFDVEVGETLPTFAHGYYTVVKKLTEEVREGDRTVTTTLIEVVPGDPIRKPAKPPREKPSHEPYERGPRLVE